MNATEHLADRAERARRIVEFAQYFKICEGCESIVTERVIFCPSCHGYRFNDDPLDVIAQANLLASRPQEGVAPGDFS